MSTAKTYDYRNKYGWRIPEWCDAVGRGKSYVHVMIKKGTIESSKVNGARIITTHPMEFLTRHADKQEL